MNKNTDKNIGFIGAGKMASAIMKGLISCKLFAVNNIFASEVNTDSAKKVSEDLGIKVFNNNIDLIKNSDIVVIATKPFIVKDLLKGHVDCFRPEQLIITIAAGISTEAVETIINKKNPVIRVMPNTPALLECGMSAICKGKYASEEDMQTAMTIFSKIGRAIKCEEKDIDAVTGVSGSGPAFYYYIINEIAKAGEKLGLDYKTALTLSAQTAMGAAKMVLETDMTPAELITAVTTPGGTTAEGNKILNNSDIAEILHETVFKTAEKSKEMSK